MKQNHPKHPLRDDNQWIFSYADLMSLLCCFFILLYSVTVDEDEAKKISKLMSEAFSGADTQIVPEDQIKPMTQSRQLRAFQLLSSMLNLGDSVEDAVGNIERKTSMLKNSESFKKDLKSKLNKKQIKNLEFFDNKNVDEETLVEIIIPSKIMFSPGSAKIKNLYRKDLAKIAAVIEKNPHTKTIEIEGHTDKSVAKGLTNSNYVLSAMRATSVANILINNGVPDKKIKIIGMGSTDPLAPEVDRFGQSIPQNMAKNRRIVIKVRQYRYE